MDEENRTPKFLGNMPENDMPNTKTEDIYVEVPSIEQDPILTMTTGITPIVKEGIVEIPDEDEYKIEKPVIEIDNNGEVISDIINIEDNVVNEVTTEFKNEEVNEQKNVVDELPTLVSNDGNVSIINNTEEKKQEEVIENQQVIAPSNPSIDETVIIKEVDPITAAEEKQEEENNKKEKKKKLFMIIGGSILLIGLLILVYFLFIKDDTPVTPEEKAQAAEKMTKKVVVEKKVIEKDNILFSIKNDNDSTITVDIDINFYDEKDNLVYKTNINATNIPGKRTVYKYPYIGNIEYKNVTYSVVVSLPEEKPEFRFDFIDITDEEKDDFIHIDYSNNSKKVLNELDIMVLFYRKNVIVGYSDKSKRNVQPNTSDSLELPIPYSGKSEVEYDKYEVYINNAYSLKEE